MKSSAKIPAVLSINNYHYPRGGSDVYHLSLARLLQERGHRVHVLSTENARNVRSYDSAAFVKPVDLRHPGISDIVNFIYSRHSALVLRHFLKNVKPDVAHLHIYYGHLTASILNVLKQAGIPCVQTLHDYKIVCPVYALHSKGEICQRCNGRAFWHCARKRCNRNSFSKSMLSTVESYVAKSMGSLDKIDHFITVSDFVHSKMIELGLPAGRITTIHNFTDVSTITPGSTPGSYFLYVGRLEVTKGLMTLLEAASTVTDPPLLIAGDGEAARLMRKTIAERRLHHVHLLGFKQGEELSRLIRNSICTVAPAEWYEPFGLTLIESFAHGRPVIASRIGGMAEIVTDGEDGFLVPPGDVRALKDRLEWMAGHREASVRMGIAGRRKVERHFSPEVHYQRLSDLYRRLA